MNAAIAYNMRIAPFLCRVSSAVERCPEEAGVPSSTLGPGIFCGHSLVVGRDLAKIQARVRFSLAAYAK